MKVDRRNFLMAALGAGGSLLGLKAVKSIQDYDLTKHEYVFVVDSTRCIGCGRCVLACRVENQLPEEHFRTWVERYSYQNGWSVSSPGGGTQFQPTDAERSYFVPKLCNHCDDPPCVNACPVGATYKTPEGVVLVDHNYCIACGYCVQACPYGARYLYPSDGPVKSRRNTADKCTLCYHRLVKGSPPACVEVCPTKARRIFDIKDEEQKEEFRSLMESKRTSVLKPEQGTEPRVFYIGIGSEVK